MTKLTKKPQKKTTKKTTKKVVKTKDKAKELEELIWAAKEQCESVCEINRSLISQYCRFAVMADELSLDIESDQKSGAVSHTAIMNKLDLYEKMSKQVLQLFKVLHLDSIKDQLAAKRNEFLAALEEDDD